MAIIKKDTLTVVTGGTAQTLNVGFIPSYFRMENKTKITNTTNGVVVAEWYNDLPNGTAYIVTTSGGDGTMKLTYQATNGITPFITGDDALFIPNQAPYNDGTRVPMGKSTNLRVTNISQAANAVVTATNSFTSADVGVTWVTFSQVHGMTQINTLRGLITEATSGSSFKVNIDTTSFSPFNVSYVAIANVITGAPVTTQFGPQIQQTPSYNRGIIGLTLGTALMVTTSDVWEYYALLDTSANG